MKSQKVEKRYVSILTVRAFGAGIIDMMRYDCCVPATEEDAHKVMRLTSGDDKLDDRIVRLIRYAAAPVPATSQRWESFGCRVLDERNPDSIPLTNDEASRLVQSLVPFNG